MKGKFAWVILSCLMALSLVLASCAPAITEEEEEVVVTEEEEEEVVEEEEEEEAPGPEVPKYGGTFNFALWEGRQSERLDSADGTMMHVYPRKLVHDRFLIGDWTKGPAGTNETGFIDPYRLPFDLLTGGSCESWEIVDDTHIFHVRPGMHFALDPTSEASRLVGGREVTAEDFAYSLRRLWLSPKSYMYTNRPWKKFFEELDGGPWIKATDKYTFEMKCLPGLSWDIFNVQENQWGWCLQAREIIEKYGNGNDWENVVGIGPFMLVDAIPGSSWSFERNPNYWQKDPIGPGKGNQLPYLDGVKLLEIFDASTRLAGLRTGKLDWMMNLPLEDKASLIKSTPEMRYKPYPTMDALGLFFRVDKPEIPLYDIRVRRALLLAFDNPTVLETYYSGDGQILTHPTTEPDYRHLGYALDEYPREIQELYEYHPDKARELLAEAGYPDGFKTSVVTTEENVDLLSIAAAYWADIGVELEIDVREYSIWNTMVRSKKTFESMGTYRIVGYYWDTFTYTGYLTTLNNISQVSDPYLTETMDLVRAAGWDFEKRAATYKERYPIRYNELALSLQFPAPNIYAFWWPWIKNYNGEICLGYSAWIYWTRFIWIDQDMKEAMVGVR